MRRTFINLSLTAFSIALSFLLFEAGYRVYLTGSLTLAKNVSAESAFFQHDPVTGWAHVPGYKGRFASLADGFNGSVSFDHLGLRNNSNGLAEKLEGYPAIVILGDSVVAGLEVDDDKTLSSVLERQLFEHGCKYRVYNAGVRGYGTDQSYWTLKKLKKTIDPQVTIYVYISNDLSNNRTIKRFRKDHGKPVYVYDGQRTMLVNPDYSKFSRSYYAYVQPANGSYRILEGNREGFLMAAGFLVKENLAIFNIAYPFYVRYFDPRESMELLNGEERVYDADLLKSVMGMMRDLSKSFFFTDNPLENEPDKIRHLIDRNDGLAAAYLDLGPYFPLEKRKYTWKYDGHWNELGHRSAALGLFGELRKRLCASANTAVVN